MYPDESSTIMDPNSSAKHFRGSVINSEFKVSSTAYYIATKGLTEAFNKTIAKLLKKFILKSQRDWDDKLEKCLWAYHTIVRTPIKATPFFLYGCEVVLLLKIQILSLRVALTTRMTDEEKH